MAGVSDEDKSAPALWQEYSHRWAGLQQKLSGDKGTWRDWVPDVPGTSEELVPVKLAERIKQLPVRA